jgi:alanine racemase
LLDIPEAERLRQAGWRKPILLLEGCFAAEDLAPLAALELTPVIHSAAQLAMLGGAVLPRPIDVYLKVNSGMNRLGFAESEVTAAWNALRSQRAVRSITLMTHFADADGDKGIVGQLECFGRATQALASPCCLANSAALIRYPESRRDWVRPGIILYGCSPFPDRNAEALGLRPAMTLESTLIGVQHLRAGDGVGYGFSFRAPRDMRIGVVACGYGDGYPRHAPSGTPVLVNGRRTATVGRVSMDLLCVDLANLPQAGIGTPVTLWGEGLSADEVATAAGTVSYELLCGLTARVPIMEAD